MADTLSSIEAASHIELTLFRDSGTGRGFFAAEAAIEGLNITYLLRGELGAKDAVIVARVELYEDEKTGDESAEGFRGDRLTGGEIAQDWYGDIWEISDFFAKISR